MLMLPVLSLHVPQSVVNLQVTLIHLALNLNVQDFAATFSRMTYNTRFFRLVHICRIRLNVFVWRRRWRWVRPLKKMSTKAECICVETEVEVGKSFKKMQRLRICVLCIKTEVEVGRAAFENNHFDNSIVNID